MSAAKRGFAVMSPEARKELASRGGKAVHALGRAHKFTSEEARIAGKKGGSKISEDKTHMSRIGKLGGSALVRSKGTRYMSQIARHGNSANGLKST